MAKNQFSTARDKDGTVMSLNTAWKKRREMSKELGFVSPEKPKKKKKKWFFGIF